VFSFSVINGDGEIYTWTADFSIATRNSMNRVKEGFAVGRYPGVRIPASSTMLRLVKKVRSTGSFEVPLHDQ
jgi:hypothetical protein